MTEFELILMQEMLKAYLIAFKDPFQNDKWPSRVFISIATNCILNHLNNLELPNHLFIQANPKNEKLNTKC